MPVYFSEDIHPQTTKYLRNPFPGLCRKERGSAPATIRLHLPRQEVVLSFGELLFLISPYNFIFTDKCIPEGMILLHLLKANSLPYTKPWHYFMTPKLICAWRYNPVNFYLAGCITRFRYIDLKSNGAFVGICNQWLFPG